MQRDFDHHRLFCLSCVAIMILGAGTAQGQSEYPKKPVKLVVGSSPGGGTDTTARLIQPKLSEFLGQQVLVENRPGAASMIGAEYVARSDPDGYTLFMGISTMTIVPSTYRKLRFDPIKDFAPISKVVSVPQLLVSHPSLPPKNVKELIAFAKAHPGQLNYAAGGYGGNPHMSMVQLINMTGMKIVYVPYKSGNAGLTDTLTGEMSIMMANMLSALPYVRVGRLRAYGVTTAKRAPGAPDIPTIAESGVPGYDSVQWFGVLAPAGTPRGIITRLHRDVLRVVDDPGVNQGFIRNGGTPESSPTPADFGNFMKAEIAKWAKVVQDANMKRR